MRKPTLNLNDGRTVGENRAPSPLLDVADHPGGAPLLSLDLAAKLGSFVAE